MSQCVGGGIIITEKEGFRISSDKKDVNIGK